MRPHIWLAVVVMANLWPDALQAADWPHWRGPAYTGISAETDWTWQWSADGPAEVWHAEVGTGFSSIAVAGGRAFTSGHQGGNDTFYCFDALTGEQRWSYSYPAPLVDNLHEGGPAATPTVDGGLVYTYSKDGRLLALHVADGSVAWQAEAGKLADVEMPAWGFSSSPLVLGNKVIVDAGRVMAFEKTTGNILWQTDAWRPGYGTAVPLTFDGQACIAVLNNDVLLVAQVADGKVLATYPWETDYITSASTPVVVGNELFVSTGYNRGCTLLKWDGKELVKVYENRHMRNHMANSVLWEGGLFGIDGNSHNRRLCEVACIDAASGESRWHQRGLGCGSLLLAAGKLLVLSDEGELVVANATSEKFDVLARAKILDGRCWTVPTLANGLLYARNADGHLVCVDLRRK
ncbi:MAG: PQQ-binding-like beta-propeller repeat protein [Planctomycetes bacterium]|nr:PQQ-binding-like beta-propeller repeat protein [Planctomycetota bacterium]